MYVGRDLVFVQIQKTASTHIAHLLQRLYGGDVLDGPRKHAPAPAEVRTPGRTVLASIRDPWDWYVSLWAFGAAGRGFLFGRLTRKNRAGTADRWSSTYSDPADPSGFREWLRLIHDPERAADIRDEYGEMAPPWGYLTHRVLTICWERGAASKPRSISDAIARDRELSYVDRFIRMEDLPGSLVGALEPLGLITGERLRAIEAAPPVNESARPLELSEYYDAESIDLVARREEFVLERFGYEPPA